MSSGPSIDIVRGLPGTQIEIDQIASEVIAKENEERIARELEPDFFVGPNGKTLPKVLKKWIGTSRRESLLKKAKNPKVKNAVNQLYRPGSFIGDGGTASVIKFEKATGLGLGSKGNTHVQKGREMLKYIETKVLTQKNLTASDRKLARQLAKSLKRAMWR
ncbi:MAG: hypothetical protein MJ116_06440 [Lachnospiraceae bacterium]|nr:hypothetical protein [Lachnospiraceae bacterium]